MDKELWITGLEIVERLHANEGLSAKAWCGGWYERPEKQLPVAARLVRDECIYRLEDLGFRRFNIECMLGMSSYAVEKVLRRKREGEKLEREAQEEEDNV